ncbi:Caspase-like protein [Brazilian cedratvirus IHUMI]|uniref:Caspase-like protein n=1 Tax=Brazilian cedratvirus IHUMI TaxID=2126980 RepID=A0A2R8FDR2_9VIRU|nr:Caspase-like protein [Brazilian cedratvirus IHUMI]
MLVLLVGFVYPENKYNHKELIGNYVDLYHLYSYFKKITDNIMVMTDLVSPEDSNLLIDAVKQNLLPEALLTFTRSLSWAGKLHPYTCKNDLEKLLSQKDEQIFVYFSGHSSQGKLILPDTVSGMETLTFRQKLESDNAGSEIFMIFDCCDADGTRLPFILSGESYVLSSPAHFTTKKTICLCSTRKGEDSASKIIGSVFTRCFLNQIENRRCQLSELLENINTECQCYPQTATLYSSFPNLKKIWSWLYKR